MSKAHILLVEDEALSSLHTATMLRGLGYEVTVLGRGEAAVERFSGGERDVDLVLMDITLGDGMDGLEAAEAILRIREIPIVFLSVHADDETVAKAGGIDSYGFVAKNEGSGILDASIRMALRLFEARAALATKNSELQRKVDELGSSNESLAASESRFSKLFDQNPAAMIITRAEDGFILNVNGSFCSLYGIGREELVGHVALPGGADLWVSPEDRGRYVRMLEATEEALGFEAEFRRGRGRSFVGSISGRFIELEGEQYILSVLTDITEKKTAQAALERLGRIESFVSKATQLMLRETDEARLLEGACDIAVEDGGFCMAWIGILAGNSGKIVPAASAGKVDGYLDGIDARIAAIDDNPVRSALRKRRIVTSADIAADERPMIRDERDRALALGYRSAAAIPLLSGSRVIGVYCVYSEKPNFFGDAETNLLGQFAMDIAFALDLKRAEREKEEAERKMRESDDLYRESFMQSAAVKLLVDPRSGEIVDANPAASAFYGYPMDELKTMGVTGLNTSSLEVVRENMSLVRSKSLDHFEVRHRLASGEERDVEVFSSPIKIGGKEYLHSIIHDITEKVRAEKDLKRLVGEKETLMKELQHRVKNNLNVVVGLLSLEAERCRDEEASGAFANAISRVGSIAAIYEKLYDSKDMSSIDMGPYAEELAASLFSTYNLDPSRIALRTDFDALRLDSKRSVPFGLILNELVSNALKYAYPGDERGEVRISLRSRNGQASLLVEDDGPGVPEAYRGEDADSMGMTLVRMLAQQLKGSFELDCGPPVGHPGASSGPPTGRGTRASLTFPV
jgi:PAS domain S-box-containing protein